MTGHTPEYRSLLFVPADRPDLLQKAYRSAADAIIVDLEDAIAPAHKQAAAAGLREQLQDRPPVPVYVRSNAPGSQWIEADLKAVIPTTATGVMLPKISSSDELQRIEELIAPLESSRGTRTRLEVLPLIESAAGVANAADIARAGSRLRRLAFGALDYAADLRLPAVHDPADLDIPKGLIAIAARAAGLQPIDSVNAEFQELREFRAEALRALRLGFTGKLCIHPRQVAVANDVFAPSASEIEHARLVLDRLARADAAGSGVATLDGQMLDRPAALAAHAVLERARALGLESQPAERD